MARVVTMTWDDTAKQTVRLVHEGSVLDQKQVETIIFTHKSYGCDIVIHTIDDNRMSKQQANLRKVTEKMIRHQINMAEVEALREDVYDVYTPVIGATKGTVTTAPTDNTNAIAIYLSGGRTYNLGDSFWGDDRHKYIVSELIKCWHTHKGGDVVDTYKVKIGNVTSTGFRVNCSGGPAAGNWEMRYRSGMRPWSALTAQAGVSQFDVSSLDVLTLYQVQIRRGSGDWSSQFESVTTLPQNPTPPPSE